MTADVFDILAKATDGAATGADNGHKSGSQQKERETFHGCIHRFEGGGLTLFVWGEWSAWGQAASAARYSLMAVSTASRLSPVRF